MPDRTKLRAVARLVAAVVVTVGVAAVTLLSAASVPAPAGPDAPASTFSAARALADLDRFAAAPRPLGSPAAARARDFLADRLRAAGFTVTPDDGTAAFERGARAGFGVVHDVLATLPGTAPTGTVLLVAHYDTADGTPAAADGASVAALLEVARAVRTGPAPRNTVAVLLTDGELAGGYGTARFTAGHPPRPGDLVIDTSARGTSGPPAITATTPGQARLAAQYLSTVPFRDGGTALATLGALLPDDDGLAAFSAAGYRGLAAGVTGGTARHDTAVDTTRFVDPGSVQAIGDNLLALTDRFAAADLGVRAAGEHVAAAGTGAAGTGAGAPDEDTASFAFLGIPVTFDDTLPLVVLACVAVLVLVLAGVRQRRLRVGHWLIAVLSVPVPLAVAGVLGFGWWYALRGIRPGYADIAGANPFHPGLYWLAVSLFGVVVIGAWFLVLRNRIGSTAPIAGGITAAAGGAVALVFTVPGTAFLLALPVIAAAFGTAAALLLPRGKLAVAGLGSVPATVLLAPLIYHAYQIAGLSAAPVIAAASALALLFWLPCFDIPRVGARHRAAPLIALGLAVVCSAAGLAVDRTDADHPARTDLVYLATADDNRDYWVSRDRRPDDWTRQYVRNGTSTLFGDPAFAAPAPAVPAQPPALRSIGDRLVVSSPRGATHIELQFTAPIGGLTLLGSRPLTVHPTGAHPTVVLDGLPRAGVVLRLQRAAPGPMRCAVVDRTAGLPLGVRYPADVMRSPRQDADSVLVTKNYVIS